MIRNTQLLSSKNKEQVAAEIQTLEPAKKSEDIIRDSYVLEFLGLSSNDDFYENDLEQALITHMQKVLLELGRGFSFVAREKRITFDGRHFRIDLVFYNYILKCFVLIDLKVGDLTHQDLGQLQMYVHYYERERMNEGDNPPIGIVLCADKNESVAEYTLSENETQIFDSKYKLYLPSEEELNQEYQALEASKTWEEDSDGIKKNKFYIKVVQIYINCVFVGKWLHERYWYCINIAHISMILWGYDLIWYSCGNYRALPEEQPKIHT